MKKIFLLSSIPALLFVLINFQACQKTTNSHANAISQVAPVDQEEMFTVLYRCADQKTIRVVYDNRDAAHPIANVQIDMRRAKIIQMKRVLAASGVRYSDGKLIWWNKGKTGFLTEATGAGKVLNGNCREYKIVN